MGFLDGLSTTQKLLLAGGAGLGGLLLMSARGGGGSGDEGELAIVDVRRPTDDINSLAGQGGGRQDINITLPPSTVPPGTGTNPPPITNTDDLVTRQWARWFQRRNEIRHISSRIAVLRQGPENREQERRIKYLRERRANLQEKLPPRPIPPAPDDPVVVPTSNRETRRIGRQT